MPEPTPLQLLLPMTLLLACYTTATATPPQRPSSSDTFVAMPPANPVMPANRILLRLSHTLDMILLRTCAAHNMSIFVSTMYLELLPLYQQRRVHFVLSYILYRHRRQHSVPILMDRVMGEQLNLRIKMMIFFVQNLQQLMVSLSRNARTNAAHKHLFLIILLHDGEHASAEMRRIFGYMLHERYNIDVLLLLMQSELGKLRAYSFWPYGADPSCGSVEPVAVFMRQAQLRQLYPRKLNNFYGCPMHVILWDIPSYIQIEADGSISGWDAAILKLLAAHLNFSISVIPNEPRGLIGGVSYMNGTLSGAFHMLRDRRANITIGCAACSPARYKYLAATNSYNQIEYVMVLRAGRRYSSFEIMLFPFDSSTWQLLVGLAVLRLCTARWLRGLRSIPAPVLIGWSWLLFALRIGYESSVFDYVHNAPARPLPRTLDEAFQQNYSFITDHSTYRMIAMLPTLNSRSHICPGLPTDIFGQLLQQPRQARVAALSNRDFFAHHLLHHPQQHNLFSILDEKVMNNMVCMYFPMGSYWANLMNDLLLDLRSFGICQHLSNGADRWQSSDFTTLAAQQHPLLRRVRKTAANVQFEESMRFLYAALSCLVVGEAVTLAIFGLELLGQQPRWRCLRWFFDHI